MHPDSGSVVMFLSLVGAFWLRLFAWPDLIAPFNPDWVLLVIIYWCLAVPQRFGVGPAWLTGLLVDAATGRLLGQHAFIYGLIAFICVRFHTRLRVFPLHQQLSFILLFLLVTQFLMFWLEALRGKTHLSWEYWLPSLTGTLAWPAVLTLCRTLKQRYLTSP
ncbi:rod shape-determining protein MreD [Methylohalobius crimeensis]|uniref:rod shape-determining protein MreD n=1 Tax=Methylohalobius crimeensis TaxID=244365 RepID=UPI0003B6DB49|nr:rod shape-determining protein MreD [Methylohalobius crimeensis]MBN2701487.1 rod shape-determining protein MreD [Methylothermaceae bacterium]